MFGMEKQKKSNSGKMEFDLEKESKDPQKLRAMRERVETRTQQLKQDMRAGTTRQQFDTTKVLLEGYVAASKVLDRLNRVTQEKGTP